MNTHELIVATAAIEVGSAPEAPQVKPEELAAFTKGIEYASGLIGYVARVGATGIAKKALEGEIAEDEAKSAIWALGTSKRISQETLGLITFATMLSVMTGDTEASIETVAGAVGSIH